MQTIDEFCQQLGLTEEQSKKMGQYISQLTIELLLSIKEDNVRNFDETIEKLKDGS